MPSRKLVRSAESVTAGQSDKLCDIIVDTILDNVLASDRFARVDLDAMAAPGLVLVAGELSTKAYVDITGTVRRVLEEIGYDNTALRFCARSIAVLNILQEQSEEIALAVDRRGAGNQGILIGYATNETAKVNIDTELMPLPIFVAHRLAERLTKVRATGEARGLYPDGQIQSTFLHEESTPIRLLNATICAHHDPAFDKDVREVVMEMVLKPTIAELGDVAVDEAELLVNPAGPFTRGGPDADVGMSGRMTATDLYGAAAPCGDLSLSGKDPTKTDRAATYMARHLAKNVVAADLADRCEVCLAYLFGRPDPISIQVNTFATGKLGLDKDLAAALRKVFDLSTAGIVEHLDLWRVAYAPLCCYGHVGRIGAPWEEVTHGAEIRTAIEDVMKGN
jgi:S-adenosylmethionine synthetase